MATTPTSTDLISKIPGAAGDRETNASKHFVDHFLGYLSFHAHCIFISVLVTFIFQHKMAIAWFG